MKLKYSLIFLLTITLPACSDTDSAELPPPTEHEVTIEATAEHEVIIEATAEQLPITGPFLRTDTRLNPPQKTATGLQYLITADGIGRTPQSGDLVAVHYRGNLKDGTEFDSSYDKGKPIQFTLGTGEVIPGWDEGVGLLKEGGVAKLIIPPELAYGADGSGGVIPPNATLYLDVELVSVWPGDGFIAPAEVFEADYITTESGLKYYDFKPGSGPSPQSGQKVTVHSTGWFEDESMFDSTRLRAQPLSFVLGEGKAIVGWEEGIASMKVGGKRQLIVPPELAYGQEGAGGGAIPPDSTLIFEVELLSIE